MKPTDVLTQHLDLVSHLEDYRFQDTLSYCFKLGWFASEKGAQDVMGNYLAGKFGQGVRGATDFMVTRDMQQLLLHAADSLDADDYMDMNLAPSVSGFVRFEVPVECIDIRGRVLKAHYLTWTPVIINSTTGGGDPALLITWWNDARDPDEVEGLMRTRTGKDVPEEYIRQTLGTWRWIGADVVTTGWRLGEEIITPTIEAAALVEAEGDVPVAGTNMLRIVHALWLMLEQTITVVREEQVERATGRRAKRKNLPSGVTVVQLRRAEYVGGGLQGHADVVWKHRWIVRGHWRWQVCGPKHALAQETSPGVYRARIWIAPFVKGPEGAELIVTEKINVLSR